VLGRLFTLGLCATALLGASAFLSVAGAAAPAAAASPSAHAQATPAQPHETSFHVDGARLAALRAAYGETTTTTNSDRVAMPASSGQTRAATSPPPLNLANFVIVSPNGEANAISGPVTFPFGGTESWQVMTQGYVFGFDDYAKGLNPGQYNLSVDGEANLQNDPYCRNSAYNFGEYEIDQASYDSTGTLKFAAVQFDIFCADGTEVFGTFAYNILNTTPNQGYYIFDQQGDVTGFGNDSYLLYLGSPATLNLNAPIIDMVPTPDGNGYWMLSSDGGIFAYGDAVFYGSMGGQRLNAPVVGLASTQDGRGYWLVASDGGIFAFGDATFLGSRGGQPLNKPIVGMARAAGGGYWLVASDGGIFSYGGAPFLGSTGSMRLNKPIVAMTATSDGKGYWFVASDGGIFAYGDAHFAGSAGAMTLAAPIVGMLSTPSGGGYWLVASDGGIFTYGDASFAGSLGGSGDLQVTGMAA
jgi:hypothetical protein